MSCEASAPEPWWLMTAGRGARLAPSSLQNHPSLVCSIALLDGCARQSNEREADRAIGAGAGRSRRPLAGGGAATLADCTGRERERASLAMRGDGGGAKTSVSL